MESCTRVLYGSRKEDIEMPKKLPHKFWNLLYCNGVNPNNYNLVRNDHESFIVQDIRTGKILLPIRY